MEWYLRDDEFWKPRVFDWWVEDGVPVIAHSVGSYPSLMAADGRTTKDVAYVRIKLSGPPVRDTELWNTVSVSIVDNGPGGCGFSEGVWVGKFEPTENPATLIREAKKHIGEAIAHIPVLRSEVAEAKQRLEAGNAFTSPMTREQYEAACREIAVDILTDEDCQSYGVKYGDFRYPQYSPDHVLTMKLASLRLAGITQAVVAAKNEAGTTSGTISSNKPPRQTGQLWEPCRKCGREPIYMPLMVCDDCWPKA